MLTSGLYTHMHKHICISAWICTHKHICSLALYVYNVLSSVLYPVGHEYTHLLGGLVQTVL